VAFSREEHSHSTLLAQVLRVFLRRGDERRLQTAVGRTCMRQAATGEPHSTQRMRGPLAHAAVLVECTALHVLAQPLLVQAMGRNWHSAACAAARVKKRVAEEAGQGQGLFPHSELSARQEWSPAASMRLRHTAAQRCTSSFVAARSASSACSWMTASLTSGVSALAKMLKLLRRPLTSAASHALKRNMLPSRKDPERAREQLRSANGVGIGREGSSTGPPQQRNSRHRNHSSRRQRREAAASRELMSEAGATAVPLRGAEGLQGGQKPARWWQV